QVGEQVAQGLPFAGGVTLPCHRRPSDSDRTSPAVRRPVLTCASAPASATVRPAAAGRSGDGAAGPGGGLLRYGSRMRIATVLFDADGVVQSAGRLADYFAERYGWTPPRTAEFFRHVFDERLGREK